jgi:ribulose-phosphate 3-epimerase
MVADPLKELKRWQKVEQVVRILVHYESVPDFKAILPTLHAYGWEIGIVLNPDTPIDAIMPFVNDIKSVMFMGVNPGKQGQKLIPEVLTKIKKFSTLYPDMFTELDGAVNEETLPEIIKSGVKAICPGSAVFKNGRTAKENIQSMEKIILQLKG